MHGLAAGAGAGVYDAHPWLRLKERSDELRAGVLLLEHALLEGEKIEERSVCRYFERVLDAWHISEADLRDAERALELMHVSLQCI